MQANPLSFAVWSDAGGQDDLVWYQGSRGSDGVWTATVPISRHKTAGSYSVHCYGQLGASNTFVGAVGFFVTGPSASVKVTSTDPSTASFTAQATLKAPLGASRARLAVWCSSVGGQDDLVWYDMPKTGGTSTEAIYTLTVSASRHKYQQGTYVGHLYAYDAAGMLAPVPGISLTVTLPPAKVEAAPQGNGSTYLLKASGGMALYAPVKFAVWSDAGGQDDLVWYQGSRGSDGASYATVLLSNHMTPGAYAVHCYAQSSGTDTYVGGAGFSVSQDVITSIGYPIMGNTTVSQQRMVALYKSKNVAYPSSIYASRGAPTIESFVSILCAQAAKEGVRAEVVFCQAMHETGWLQFKGDVKAEQCNFAGLGATGGGEPGNVFPDVATGLLAQVQHLKCYASTDPLNYDCVDQRWNESLRGVAPTVNQLGGKWATDRNYGTRIINLIHSL